MPTLSLLLTALLGASGLATKTILTPEDVLSRPYASLAVDNNLASRQDDSPAGETIVNSDGSLNLTAWNTATNAACKSTLAALPRAASASGMSICFNLPSLDTQKGAFEADLRLYHVSQGRGVWAGVKPADVDVNVGFPNAQVSSVKDGEVRGVGMVGKLAARGRDKLPELLQSYLLVGQINQSRMSDGMDMSSLEALVMPSLRLAAATESRNVTTTLSPNEASFLTGVFSDKSPQSNFSAAQSKVDAQLQRLSDGDIAFILPGTQILIFPIGLIITGTWLVLGVSVYGFGTVERWRFREVYRPRAKALEAMGRTAAQGM